MRPKHHGYLKRAIGGGQKLAIAALADLARCTRGKWKLDLVWKFESNFGSITESTNAPLPLKSAQINFCPETPSDAIFLVLQISPGLK